MSRMYSLFTVASWIVCVRALEEKLLQVSFLNVEQGHGKDTGMLADFATKH